MDLGLVLDMAASTFGDRRAVSHESGELTYDQLRRHAWGAARTFGERHASTVIYLGTNHPAFPVALFGAAAAGVPLLPLNYRLGQDQLHDLIVAPRHAVIVHDGPPPEGIDEDQALERTSFLASLRGADEGPPPGPADPAAPAVLLQTSGTTSAPKLALLRQHHLTAYLLATVEFAGAGTDEAALVSVPPYHIAGLANLLSNLYAGRRVIYLPSFDPEVWLQTVRTQRVTHAMVVPTMLTRIVRSLAERQDADAPGLATLSYGGSRIPPPVLRRALELFPSTDFVNAYGLTETSSTVSLLGPEDHRAALGSADPRVARRLGSVGRPVPGVEIEIHRQDGSPADAEEPGSIMVHGDQISGEYSGRAPGRRQGGEGGARSDGDWFATRDRGWLDGDGYLFIEGRADDTIIRGGENISPVEIEDVLIAHPAVSDAVVVGVPDEEWGQRLVAVVVLTSTGVSTGPDHLRRWVRSRLRSSKTPEAVHCWDELPRTETGKILRRRVVEHVVEEMPDRRAAVSDAGG